MYIQTLARELHSQKLQADRNDWQGPEAHGGSWYFIDSLYIILGRLKRLLMLPLIRFSTPATRRAEETCIKGIQQDVQKENKMSRLYSRVCRMYTRTRRYKVTNKKI